MTAQKPQSGDEPTEKGETPLGNPGAEPDTDAQPQAGADDGGVEAVTPSAVEPAPLEPEAEAEAAPAAAVGPADVGPAAVGSADAEAAPAAAVEPAAVGPAVVGPAAVGSADAEAAPAAAVGPAVVEPGAVEPDADAEAAAVEPADTEPEAAAALTAERLLEPRNRPPVGGWRRWLYTATLGRVNVGDSDAVRLQRIREHRIAAPLGGGTRYVPVLSRKGGVGKTTVTTLLGMALAQVREDRVIALDANPDRGTLTDRSPGRARYTARQLVQNRFMVDSFSKLSAYAAHEGSRLHVLASDTDPHVAEAFDDADYRAVTDLLSKFYSIVLTDSGTGMVHSVMNGTLEKADTVVLVSGASVDEARLASETLSWLEAHGRGDLAQQAIVVINQSAGQGNGASVEEIEAHFLTRVDTVVRLPHDPHLAEGARIELERLRPATREAVMELASHVVENLRS